MVVGKTQTSISKGELFNRHSETEVLSSVFPEVITLPCLINSPLRKDEHPSFYLYLNNQGNVRWKDYALQEEYGGLLDLLCKYWKCSFKQALDKIAELPIFKNQITIKPKGIRTFTRKESNALTSIQVAVRPWRKYDYEYWASYGIESKYLHWAEIYPISYKIVTKKDYPEAKPNKYIFAADKYAYCYVERKEGKLSLKIYQPFNKKGFKWCSKMDGSVIGLWTKIPEKGDKVIICSSIKDALCIITNLHIPCLCLQGEGYDISTTAINELKRRYKQVYISFDGDEAGKKDAQKLSEQTGFSVIPCPLIGNAKDWSDIYHYYGKERLITEFNHSLYPELSIEEDDSLPF